MTFFLFFTFFIAIFILLLNFLPVAVPLSSTFSVSFATLVASMKAWNFILPIDELFQVFVFLIVFESLILLFKIIRWIVHLVRGHESS